MFSNPIKSIVCSAILVNFASAFPPVVAVVSSSSFPLLNPATFPFLPGVAMSSFPIKKYAMKKLATAAKAPINNSSKLAQFPCADRTPIPPPISEINQSIIPAENPNPLEIPTRTTIDANTPVSAE